MLVPVARGRERHPIVTGIFILIGLGFCGTFLFLLLSGPASNGITTSDSDTDPYFVLVTPTSGARSGKVLYLMDWDDSNFEIHPAQNTKALQKVQLELEWAGDGEFRLASPKEVQLLGLPYDRRFKTDDGTTEVSVKESDGTITIRRAAGNRTRVCTYSPNATGPNFRY